MNHTTNSTTHARTLQAHGTHVPGQIVIIPATPD